MTYLRSTEFFLTVLWVWLILCVAASLYFRFGRNAKHKRLVFPVAVVTSAVLLFAITWLFEPSIPTAVCIAAVLGFAGYASLRTVGFCGTCGATVRGHGLLTRPTYCVKCGTRLPP